MRRALLSSMLLTFVLALTGCSRYFIKKDSYGAVKKAAVVQYAINPHMLLGSAVSEDARKGVAQSNLDTFVKEMNGTGYELMPLDQMKSNPAYASGKEAADGYFSAPGMRFFLEGRDNDTAQLSPELAKKLCADLGVDAVIVMADSWAIKPGFGGFTSTASNTYTFNMYDKNGERIWGDVVAAASTDSVGTPGGVIAASPEELVKVHTQAFGAAMTEAKAHLSK